MKSATVVREVELGRYHAPEGSDEASGALPGIVLIHDVWGLSEHSRDLASDLASEGFAVLEIDLYREMGEIKIETPGPFIRNLSDPKVLADIDAGADWLSNESAPRKVGVMGVCMGGTYTLLAACLSDRFAAAAPFYGLLSYESGLLENPEGRDRDRKPVSPLEAADRLRMPILASFGEEDEFVPVSDVRDLEGKFGAGGQPHQVDLYAGAGHAFLNRTREAAYRPDTSAEAWSKIIPFFRDKLAI